MAKKDAPAAIVHNFMDDLHAGVSKEFGANCYTAGEQMQRMFGIEIPPLAVQWLIHCNIIPMQSIITFEGKPKVYKTSTLLEIQRWFMQPPIDGAGYYIGTEGKLSPTKVSSMLGYLTNKLHLQQTPTTEGWQEAATAYLTNIEKIVEEIRSGRKSNKREDKEKYGEAFLPPIAIGVDSIGGSQTESIRDTIMKDGSGSKTFQDRALINTQWLNVWGSNMIGLPVTVIMVNHLKDSMDGGGGAKTYTTPGGVGPGFHTSLCIRATRIQELAGAGFEGAKLQWQVFFSSIGLDKRKLTIDYIETWDEAGDQKCFFDWDGCLVDLLMELKTMPLYADLKDLLGSMVEYNAGSKGKMFSCGLLGIKGEEDAKLAEMTKQKLGRLLQDPATPDIRGRLQKALKIQEFRVWQPGMDLEIPRIPYKSVKAKSGGSSKSKSPDDNNPFVSVAEPSP